MQGYVRNSLPSRTSLQQRKLITASCQTFLLALNMCSDSESDYSASCSEDDNNNNCKETADVAVHQKTTARCPVTSALTSKEVPAKKLKSVTSVSLNVVWFVSFINTNKKYGQTEMFNEKYVKCLVANKSK